MNRETLSPLSLRPSRAAVGARQECFTRLEKKGEEVMDHIYEQVLRHMERIVDDLAGRVPPPQFVEKFGAFRHVEKSIHQAIVQKLARMVSTLHAARLLCNHGFVQEQAALQRILGEIREDVLFLAFGIIRGDVQASLHQSYLDAFFEEEFDAATAIASTQKRRTIPRQKIQAYLARMEEAPMDPHRGGNLFRTISKIYSGYVHAASPQIMDMYVGNPPRFHMQGMKETEIYEAYRKDIRNYFYQGIAAFACAAKAFGDADLYNRIYDLMIQFQQEFGDLIWSPSEG